MFWNDSLDVKVTPTVRSVGSVDEKGNMLGETVLKRKQELAWGDVEEP